MLKRCSLLRHNKLVISSGVRIIELSVTEWEKQICEIQGILGSMGS